MTNQKLIDFMTSGLPKADVKLPSGSSITIRAMAVKELKVLMLANASSSSQDYQTLQVLQACVLTPDTDVFEMCSQDVEVVFVELFKLSKGTSLIPAQYRCSNPIESDEGQVCDELINVRINLSNITVDPVPDNIIPLKNGLTAIMRLPTLAEREYFTDDEADIFDLSIRCIDSLDTGTGSVLKVGVDITPEEMSEVIDYLDEQSYTSIIEYVSKMPTIRLSFPLKCPKCEHEEILNLVGLEDFFL